MGQSEVDSPWTDFPRRSFRPRTATTPCSGATANGCATSFAYAKAFLRLVAKAGEVQHHKAFLLTVADNLARDQFRKDQRRQARAHDVEAFTSASTAAPQEQALLIKQIVLALPQELRDVLVLSLIQGLTYREIAALRGIPERTVKDRMRRAMARASAALRD